MKRSTTTGLLVACLVAASLAFAQAPQPPSGVSVTASFYYIPDVYISWHSSSTVGENMYTIYRSAGDSLHFAAVGTSLYNTYVDYQIVGNQLYYYYVTASTAIDTTWYESVPGQYVSAIAIGKGTGGGGSKRLNNGRIDGRVTDSLTARPIAAAQATLYRISSPGIPVQTVLSDANGRFRASLDTGTYILKVQPPLVHALPDFGWEWYKDVQDPAQAQPLHIDDSSRLVVNIDLARQDTTAFAAINGTVMDSAGAPLRGSHVLVLRSIQEMEERSSSGDDGPADVREGAEILGLGHARGVVWQGVVDSSGHFQAKAAPGHSYVVLAVKQVYAPQFFDHQSDLMQANALVLAHDTAGIDFHLRPVTATALYSVAGSVMDSSGAGVPSRVALIPFVRRPDGHAALFSYTDSTGAFQVMHVPAGRYLAFAIPFGLYAPSYHHRHSFRTAQWQLADTITVNGDITGVDLGVSRITVGGIGHMSGRITTNGTPVHGASVYATLANGSIGGYGITDGNGAYTINGLPSENISLRGELEGYTSANATVPIGPGQFSVSGANLSLSGQTVSAVRNEPGIAVAFALDQNYPNPFNPSTTITYALPVASTVTIRIFNIVGQEVATLVNGPSASGRYEAVWTGKNGSGSQLASGVYIYRLTATPVDGGNTFITTKRMVLLK